MANRNLLFTRTRHCNANVAPIHGRLTREETRSRYVTGDDTSTIKILALCRNNKNKQTASFIRGLLSLITRTQLLHDIRHFVDSLSACRQKVLQFQITRLIHESELEQHLLSTMNNNAKDYYKNCILIVCSQLTSCSYEG